MCIIYYFERKRWGVASGREDVICRGARCAPLRYLHLNNRPRSLNAGQVSCFYRIPEFAGGGGLE